LLVHGAGVGDDLYILEGIQVYAAHQIFVETERVRQWATTWDPIRQRAREVLAKKLGEVEEEMDGLPDIIIPDEDFVNLNIDDN
jgi:hypothetical protein